MKLFVYIIGASCLLLVAAAIGAAAYSAVVDWQDTVAGLGANVVNGVGLSIGGLIGSAVVLRFKAARRFVRKVFNEAAE